MKPEDKITERLVGEAIREGQPGKVTIDSRGLYDLLSEKEVQSTPHRKELVQWLWEWLLAHCQGLRRVKQWIDFPGNRGLRFFLIAATLFTLLVATLWYGVFFINDVILHETKFYINEQGALVPQKPLGGEYALYLFNTSEIWANPGIQVSKNDRIRISISGGFNSSIEHLLDASRENTVPEYGWVFPERMGHKTAEAQDWALNYCLSRGFRQREKGRLFKSHYFDFGTVMYTIQPESADIVSHPLNVPENEIRAWTPERRFRKANRSGYLFFAVNDLLFAPDSVGKYYDRFIKELKQSKEGKNPYQKKRICEKIKASKTEEAIVSGQDSLFLYKDNLGQLLVAVEIQRARHGLLRWPEEMFRYFENNYIWLKDGVCLLKARDTHCWGINFLKFVCCELLWILGILILFFVFGLGNLCIFLIWVVLLCAAICLIYKLVHRVSGRLRRKLERNGAQNKV